MGQIQMLSHAGLVAVVADRLRSAIAEGELKPGQRLLQAGLAQQLGISREPIRQALRLLETEGLVVQRPRRGTVVAPLEENIVRDVYDVRAGLDGMAARRAAEVPASRQLVEARRLLSKAGRHLDRGHIAALLADDRTFHLLILKATGNQIALDVARAQWNRMGAVMRAVLDRGYAARAWDEHGAILEAILSGDAVLAEQRARLHAWHAADMLTSSLRDKTSEGGQAGDDSERFDKEFVG
jgi:DNA-binding GntR family transcriptional regulator